MTELKKTPLYQEHLSLKARMVPFGGWEMPVQYQTGLIREHEAVRQAVGLFDVSHMGEFLISGPKAKEFLNHVTTNDVARLTPGACQYTILCYENGTVVDDLIVSQLAGDQYLAVVNASNIEKDFDWITSHNSFGVTLENVSGQKSLIAVQGPLSEGLLRECLGFDLSGVKYYHFQSVEFKGVPLTVFRTGYTGEDGFEIMLDNRHAAAIWNLLLDKGAAKGCLPVGLGARDTLRLEAAYSLYGHEISNEINPLEANLGWVVKLTKSDFIGRDSLLKLKEEGIKRQIVGFELTEPGIAREGCSVYDQERLVGHVTSGTHSPTLKKSIGLALIEQPRAQLDRELFVDIRGKKRKLRLVKLPFYKRQAKV